MNKITDIFPLEDLARAEADKYVNVKRHPADADLVLLDYSPKCQFDSAWNAVTLNSRGLIFRESTGEIVARPFPKFFNWDDSTQPYPPFGTVVVSNKFDGSMGTLYPSPDGGLAISTRGSFASEQALHATERFNEYVRENTFLYDEARLLIDDGFTPVFEIIYPSNRIVVDYGGADSLVLLDVIDNATGNSALAQFDWFDWPEKAEKTILSGGFSDTMASQVPDDEEGYVLYWPHSGFRCKVKGAAYVHLHRILTNTNARALWRAMAVHACSDFITKPKEWQMLGIDPADAKGALQAGADWMDTYLKDVPDEFYAWVRKTMDGIQENVDSFVKDVRLAAASLAQHPVGRERFEVANKITPQDLGRVALDFANKGNYERVLVSAWKRAKPGADNPFEGKGEE